MGIAATASGEEIDSEMANNSAIVTRDVRVEQAGGGGGGGGAIDLWLLAILVLVSLMRVRRQPSARRKAQPVPTRVTRRQRPRP